MGLEWKSPDMLPPVGVPLYIRVNGKTHEATKNEWLERSGDKIRFDFPRGGHVIGRYRWAIK